MGFGWKLTFLKEPLTGLCVLKLNLSARLMKSCEQVILEGKPSWLGKVGHSYGHLLDVPLELEAGVYQVNALQILQPAVAPQAHRCESTPRFPFGCPITKACVALHA